VGGTVRLLQALVPHYQPSAFLLQALCETEARRNHERDTADDLRNYKGRFALPTRRPHRIVPA